MSSCPHCGMPITATAPLQDGVQFVEYGCGRCAESTGWIEEPTPGCREIARLRTRERVLEDAIRSAITDRLMDAKPHHDLMAVLEHRGGGAG